jgi:shikimate kinase
MSPSRQVIALIGLRCSGKTSVGTELARILHFSFVDLDREIERRYARTNAERGDDERVHHAPTSDARGLNAMTSDARRNAPTNDAHERDLDQRNSRASDARAPNTRSSDTTPPSKPTGSSSSSPPTAGEILQSQGEPAFRALESQALTEILRRETHCVLATGGGVVEREDNRRALAEQAVCIWLRVDPAELARRMRADPTPRPSLTGLTGEDPASEIPKLALRRDPLYAALARTTLDGARLSPALLAEELARELTAREDLGLQE